LPDDRDRLSRVGDEGDILQDVFAVITEADVFKSDLAADRLGYTFDVLVKFRLAVDELEDASRPGNPKLNLVE
jgi:hypothetical protein